MAIAADNRWKAILSMSSAHAGINQELGRFRNELYRALARIDDPRDVRDYLGNLISNSHWWLIDHAKREAMK